MQRHLEETLVTLLLLEAGVDLNVVPHVEHLEADGTGLLCLEGITGPLVFLSWLDADATHQALAARGIEGRPGRTVFRQQLPAATDQAASRVIYYIDLREHTDVEPLCAEIRRIRDDLATPMFGVAGLTGGIVAPAKTTPAKTTKEQSAPAQEKKPTESPAPAPSAASGKAPAANTPASPPPAAAAADDVEEDDDPDLERLVNQLDELDL